MMFAPFVRQFTGTPTDFRAYLVEDGQIVKACPHRHSRRHGRPGSVYAERCAARMVRDAERSAALTETERSSDA